jgi:hypothetical protein
MVNCFILVLYNNKRFLYWTVNFVCTLKLLNEDGSNQFCCDFKKSNFKSQMVSNNNCVITLIFKLIVIVKRKQPTPASYPSSPSTYPAGSPRGTTRPHSPRAVNTGVCGGGGGGCNTQKKSQGRGPNFPRGGRNTGIGPFKVYSAIFPGVQKHWGERAASHSCHIFY